MEPLLRHYCERAGAGLAAEPLNAVSNLAFAWAAWRAWRRADRPPAGSRWDLHAAAALLAAVAVGSSLWHTLATPWAELADTLPIMLLVVALLEAVLRRVLGLGAAARVAALLLLLAASTALPAAAAPLGLPGWLRGSAFYLPAWAALALLALAARARAPGAARPLLLTWALFTLSLALRTADLPLCPALPRGTHFLWHLLNAVVLDRLHALLAGAGAVRACNSASASDP
jgi:hypothetical protein